jgi:excisionase family DNA binding protein
MSEPVTPPQVPVIDSASGAAPGAAPLLASAGEPPQTPASAPMLALPPGLPPETHALLEMIARGLSPEADDATRTTARDLWARFAQTIATAAPVPPVPPAPVPPAAPVLPVAPVIPGMPMPPMPTSPIAMAARAAPAASRSAPRSGAGAAARRASPRRDGADAQRDPVSARARDSGREQAMSNDTSQGHPLPEMNSPSNTPAHTASSIEHDCLNANELARYLRVDRKTVYEYAGNGVIPCRRLGRRLLFSRAAVVAWLARHPVAPNPGVRP